MPDIIMAEGVVCVLAQTDRQTDSTLNVVLVMDSSSQHTNIMLSTHTHDTNCPAHHNTVWWTNTLFIYNIVKCCYTNEFSQSGDM